MRKIYSAILLLVTAAFFSCKGEPEVALQIRIINQTNAPVTLRTFADLISVSDTFEIHIMPGDFYEKSVGRFGSNSNYPEGLQDGIPRGDSLQVIFNDTLSVSHYTYSAGYNSTHIDSSVIEYDEPRNIYNPNNYSKEKLGENSFRGTYIITEADLDYALSIHE